MKKLNYFVLSVMSLLLSTAIMAQTTVLGYFPSYRATSVVRYDKLTDIVFAFINPNTNGTLNQTSSGGAEYAFDMTKFTVIRDQAAANNVKLWIALGGADSGNDRAARLKSVCSNTTYRANLVSDLVNFAITHGCEGIDIDWEFPTDAAARAGHLALIQDLRTAINSSSNPNLKISVAVGGEYKGTINHINYLDAGLVSNASLVDKWNIMAYDFPVSYGVSHSSLSDAEQCMDTWNSSKGIPYSKMLLGVPFYGKHQSSRADLAYNAMGGGATNYNSDSYNGYYYNGKGTLEAKMDLVSNKGAKGILIWDLGQDLTGTYSLLDVIDAKAATLCPVPKANLGPDAGVCQGNTLTLNPGVAASAGRTFAWYKDGISTGTSGTTYDVSAAGTYKVVITEGSCTREDEIVVVTGSSVTTTGAAGCNNETLTLSVNNPDGSKVYKWYDSSVGGVQLGTGTTYSSVFASTTTVYVEEGSTGVVEYTSDSLIPSPNYAWDNNKRANFIETFQDVKLKSVRICTEGPVGAQFTIKILKASDNSLVWESSVQNVAADAGKQPWEYTITDVAIDQTLTAGKYFITPIMTSGNFTYNYTGFNGYSESGVVTVGDHAFTDFGSGFLEDQKNDAASYVSGGPFYNYKFEVGASAGCGRTGATATVQACGPPSVTITSPANASDHPVNNAITLSADITDEGTVTSVVFEVFKGGVLVETVSASASGSTYSGTFTPTQTGTDYTFKVTATDNSNTSTDETVAFTVSSGTNAVLVEGDGVNLYPNPSSSNFTIELTGANGFELSVYSVSGKVLETTTVSGSTATFGADLSAGVYVVKAVSAAGTFQTQVVKQ